MKGIYKRFLLLLPLLSVFILSCGNANNPAAPSTGKITIDPTSSSWEVSSTSPFIWRTEFLTIRVFQDAAGTQPMSDVSLTITCTLANPSDFYVIQFYNGAERVQSPLNVKTDKYGQYSLRFDWASGGGLEYKTPIEVRSGTLFNSHSFEVKVKTATTT